MSLLWRDQIQAFLAPGRVDLVRHYHGIKRRSSDRLTSACEQKTDSPAWEPPLEQLRGMLAGAAGAELMVTLSNHFVRYAVIPAEAKIENPAELRAYATFRMREIYGDRAGAWEFGMSEWDPSSGGVCAAVERDLMERLQRFATDHKVGLKGAEPYLTGAVDQWCAHFDQKKTWFALVERGRLCVASVRDGAWQRISNRRMVDNVEHELLAMLDQEAILFSGGKNGIEQVVLFAPEHPQLALPDHCGWRVVSPLVGSKRVPLHYPVAPDVVK